MEIFRKKNVATVIAFPMVTTASPETFITGETVTDDAYYSDAGGAWAALAITDTVAEVGTTGLYELSLTAAEMNHDNIIIKLTSTSAADTAIIIRTRAVDENDLVRATTPANTLAVNVSGEVTAATVTDKAGYSISGTKTTLDALNDVAATDIVSAGAITTLAGAVVNVDTVDSCTSNSDMRGTDNAALASELAKVPKSDGTSSWNATALAAIQGEASAALTAYDPPTNAEMEARTLVAASYGTAVNQTNIEADTQDIQARLPAALVGGKMDSDATSISGSATAAANLELSTLSIVPFTVTGTPTSTEVAATGLTAITGGDNVLVGRVIIFTSGNAIHEPARILSYIDATGTMTITELAVVPGAGDTGIII